MTHTLIFLIALKFFLVNVGKYCKEQHFINHFMFLPITFEGFTYVRNAVRQSVSPYDSSIDKMKKGLSPFAFVFLSFEAIESKT